MGFRLRKYYLDATTADGHAVIAYWASLRWGALRLRYAALDWFDASGVTRTTSSFGAPPPEESDDGVTWIADALGVSGQWRRRAEPITKDLFRRGDRSVRWSCRAPAATVALRVGDRTLEGAGYVECLDCTIEPWRLPIDVLHWGRVAEGSRTATWIAWEGSHPLQLLVVDGREVAAREISASRVAWGDESIALEPVRTLRDARLDHGALRGIPRLLRVAPLRLLAAHETKWLSRAAGAWCIHEVVRFGERGGAER
ncbi:MAG: hypothetical protein JNM94_18590 [Phycisphaerae bacterium]|nr:hypothetical protein [Phycisphaerae bacterium]